MPMTELDHALASIARLGASGGGLTPREISLTVRLSEAENENGRLRAALKTADTAMARYCSHQVGYQDAYVAFREARAEIKAALNQQRTPEK